ncbi:MAG: hypothetical protein F4145_09830 [Boseongicola sp. SB0675_bin_26]|nr:hypothetical protein [Boseongicola sp. SB0675_bin_26]
MASRPVFLPSYHGKALVEERSFDFSWASGFSEVQKKKNIMSLHKKAMRNGIQRILEISSKSEEELGKRLSAFSLKIEIGADELPLESVYQGSKVFESGGPYPEIFDFVPRDAKRFIRENSKGMITGFRLQGENYPLSPKNAFYDWLYIRALERHSSWITEKVHYDAFTDIEFNPTKQVNCQARAFAEFLSLNARGALQAAASDFEYLASMLSPI